MAEPYRVVRFHPYRRGMGPRFELRMFETCEPDSRMNGNTNIGYELWMTSKVLLFKGEDYSRAPGYSEDADETIAGLMGFLTLKPGDTDPEYFEHYTPQQLAFCEEHAESLSLEVMTRFGED